MTYTDISQASQQGTAQARRPSKRDMLREKISKKHNRQFDNDDDFDGQLYDDYEAAEKELAGYRENEDKLSSFMSQDPRSAAFLASWHDGGDPVIALIREYGTDIMEALDDPDRQEEIAAANKEYLDRVAKEKGLDEEYQANLQASLQTLDDLQAQNGWTDEQIDQAVQNTLGIVNDVVMGKFTPETIQMVMNAQNYEADVANAAQEGEVRGRNAKIEERLRKRGATDGTINLGGKAAAPRKRVSERSIFDVAAEA